MAVQDNLILQKKTSFLDEKTTFLYFIENMILFSPESHQPSGLRWFRFKTLPIFQLGGFTLPPTPFPGLWFEGFAVPQLHFIRCSFRAPFFSPLGTPQNRYHKLFRLQNGSVLGFKAGSKTGSHFWIGFFISFCRFCDFFCICQAKTVLEDI